MWLKICSGPDQGRSIECRSGMVAIGRNADCDLCLTDTTVSRRHAVLELDGPDSGQVRDEGSQNGTFVNDVRLIGPVAVRGVEQLRIGDTVIRLSPSTTAAVGPQQATDSGTETALPRISGEAHVGIAAVGNVVQRGHYVAGGDQVIYNQQLVRWHRMRRNARRLLVFSIFVALTGFGLFGSWIVRWDTSIFGAVKSPSDQAPATPSPLPWLPLGALLMFAGIVLFVTALVLRRAKEPLSPT